MSAATTGSSPAVIGLAIATLHDPCHADDSAGTDVDHAAFEIYNLSTATGTHHDLVADVCLRASCYFLKSLATIEGHLPSDRFHRRDRLHGRSQSRKAEETAISPTTIPVNRNICSSPTR